MSVHIKNRIENKIEWASGDKNRVKLIIASKNFSKTFYFKKIMFHIITLFVELFIVNPRKSTFFLCKATKQTL